MNDLTSYDELIHRVEQFANRTKAPEAVATGLTIVQMLHLWRPRIEAEARDNLATRLGTRLLDEKDGLEFLADALLELDDVVFVTIENARKLRAALLRAVETDHE